MFIQLSGLVPARINIYFEVKSDSHSRSVLVVVSMLIPGLEVLLGFIAALFTKKRIYSLLWQWL